MLQITNDNSHNTRSRLYARPFISFSTAQQSRREGRRCGNSSWGAVRVAPLKHCKNYWLFIKRRVGGTAPRDVLSPFGIQSQSHFLPTVALTLRGPLIKCTYVGNTVTHPHTHREIYVCPALDLNLSRGAIKGALIALN